MCENINFGLASTISDGDLERVREFAKRFSLRYPKGDNLLVKAIQYQCRDIAKLLLTHGCKANCIYKKTANTPLRLAIINGDVEIVEMLLRRGADIHHKDTFGSSMLHTAVEKKKRKIVKLLLDHGADVHVKNNGVNPLHLASTKQNVQIVEDLLNHGADINSVCTAACRAGYFMPVQFPTEHDSEEDSIGYTPLHIAVTARHEIVVKLLLKRGANVNAQDKRGNTVLHLAIEKGNSRIVAEVLKYCPDINNQCNRSSLKTAVCASYFSGKNVKNLLQYGFIINPEDVDNFKFLHNAVRRGHLKIVKDLLKNGADVNMVDHSEGGNGSTPLHTAVRQKQEEVAKLLLNYGVNVNAKDEIGRTPVFYAVQNSDAKITRLLLTNGADIKDSPALLHIAAADGCLEITENLLKYGFDVNMLEDQKYGCSFTPLHIAVRKKQEEVAKLLLNYGANVNAKDERERTPLFYAVQNSDAKIIRLLLTNGADIKDSPALLHIAAADGCLEITETLLKYGFDVNMLDDQKYGWGFTPLHIAVEEKQEALAKLLLNYGANVNAKDEIGRTPVFYAVQNSDAKITRLLLTNGAHIKDSPALLHIAAADGCLEIIENLLKYGFDVNMLEDQKYGCGFTPLHIAVRKKQEEVAKLLLNYGANVNAKDEIGRTPVFYAVQNSDAKITRLLLTNGAHIKDNPALLYIAAADGCLEIIENLLKYGFDVNMLEDQKYGCGFTPLHIAVEEKQEALAKLLLNYGANVNAEDERERTPLFYAVQNSDAKIIRLLLTNGADIKDSPELLHIAAASGNLEIVENLLKYGFDVNMLEDQKYGCGFTPLHIAVRKKQEEVAKLLLNYGANVNAKDERERTPLFYAVQNSDAKIIRLLLTNGADIKDSPALLHIAAADGCLEITETLLKYGFDVNMLDDQKYGWGFTPLHIAVEEKQEALAKLLLNYGANVNAKDEIGRTPVFYAVQNSDAKITRLLLTNGAHIKDSPALLHIAAADGCLEIIENLLKYGFDVNMLEDQKYGCGFTPLHIAVRKKQEEVAKLLLNYGANVNAKDEIGRTPVFYAVQNSDAKITRLLLTNGADIKDDPTLLCIAIENKCEEIVDDLLNHGVDVNKVVSCYLKPFEHAIYRRYVPKPFHGSINIVEQLKKYIVKLQAAGLYVSERNLKYIINNYEIIKFERECEGEIEIMKREKISNSYASFYDILTKNTHQLETYAKNENIVQALKSADYKTKFPIYASMIEGKFRKGLERKDLEELGNQFFHSLFKSLPELPLLCIEKIFSYLSNYDLKRWSFFSSTNVSKSHKENL